MEGEDRHRQLSRRLFAELKACRQTLARSREPVAIVGMGGRLPPGPDLASFWTGLSAGEDAVTAGRPGEPLVEFGPTAFRPFGAYLKEIDRFDASFFRIAPVEAELMDPQQRMLLETAWEALEDACLDPASLAGSRTGVFVGIADTDYQRLLGNQPPNLYIATGNSFAAAAGRIAFALGFEGPAMAIDTACSSSLVVVHQAVAALQRAEVDVAVAGGVSAIVTPGGTMVFGAGGMLAPDGRCKTFDAAADGFGRGEGCGMVVMKRLSDAEENGDRILAVVRGSAVNQDGASAGLTVPNGPSQERVIREALQRAGLEPADVDYLEAHGTGTELGDPIEIQAAAAVYGDGRPAERPLLIGSVKTNIGHLEAAAGIAGLIKVLLAIRDGRIPKHLHFKSPNPRMDWERLPVRVTAEATPWPEVGRPVRAAVSSFGISGTNAHLILESYGGPGEAVGAPVEARAGAAVSVSPERRFRVLPLSGRTRRTISRLADRYGAWMNARPAPLSWEDLSDAAWTAAVGRRDFRERAALVVSGEADLKRQLAALGAEPGEGTASPPAGGKVAFLFTGQGSQWVGMGRDLYNREPLARAAFTRADAVFREARGESLLEAMFGAPDARADLDATEWTQPALFALQAALVALWESVGVTPDAVMGHSVGELAAAHAAGFFGVEEGMRFAAERGALMGSLPREGERAGGMAAVFAPREVVRLALRRMGGMKRPAAEGASLDLAADNGAHQVVSGPLGPLSELEASLGREGIRTERVRTSHAFHSGLMAPVLDALDEAAARLAAAVPRVPLVSNLTGRVASPAELGAEGYWSRQARAPVRFADGVTALRELGIRILVEIGPGAVLGPMAALAWPDDEELAGAPVVLASQHRAGDAGDLAFLRAVAGAWEAGLPVSFAGLYAGERRRKVSLPTYPFERERHWVKSPGVFRRAGAHPLLGDRRQLPGGEVSFEIRTSELSWMSDHRVFGRVVAPGALFGALALAALRSTGGSVGSRARAGFVEDMRILRPLVLAGEGESEPAGERKLQFLLGKEDDGAGRGFEIFSRGREEDPWIAHAAGRLKSGSPPPDPDVPLASLLRKREQWEVVEPGDLYRRLAAAGVSFGPAFRGMISLRSGDFEAIGEVALPDGQLPVGDSIHPVLLDACFQVVGGLAGRASADAGGTFLPIGWRRLWLGREVPDRLWCHVRVGPGAEGEPGESLSADFVFYGAEGELVGGVEEFQVKRTSRSALRTASTGLDDLFYEVQWRKVSGTARAGLPRAGFLAAPEVIVSAVVPRERSVTEDLDGDRSDGLAAGLENLSRSWALRAFEELGWERRAGSAETASGLRVRLGLAESHERLLARLLGLLGEAGVLASGDGRETWTVVADSEHAWPDPLEDPARLAEELRQRHPEDAAPIDLIERCGAALPQVLLGRLEAEEVLRLGEPALAALYQRTPGYREGAELAARAVAAAVRDLPAGERLSVLEVGAGEGETTRALLTRLPPGRTDYTFTDRSRALVGEAERLLATWDAGQGRELTFRVLDIERDPERQGFALHRYHLVVAAHVLHATRSLDRSVENCRRLLASSGLLVVLDATRPRGFLDLTFGLLPRWWRFEDSSRTDHPMAPASALAHSLSRAGCSGVTALRTGSGASLPAADETGDGGSVAVMLARAPAEVQPDAGLWVLGPEIGGSSETAELVRELRNRGQDVVSLEAPSGADAGRSSQGPAAAPLSRESWRDFFRSLPESLPLRGVVHAAALRDPDGAPPAAGLAEDLERLSRSALALTQGLFDAGASPSAGLCFLTRGGQIVTGEEEGGSPGSVLWGFGRALRWELGAVPVRLLDLDPGPGTPAASVAEELLFPDRENEVVFRGGARLVSRLARRAVGSGAAADSERIRGDRTYLVTGGFGGIGLTVARWLAAAGAGAIVLNGRRPPEGAADAAVSELRESGANVRMEIADVADPAAVQRMVSEIGGAGLPPLGGLIHCVGALRDGLLPNQDWDSVKSVLWPKALGAWNLHEATLERKLDLFVLFSSLGGVVGNAGQTNYAAANAFLDQFALWRRGRDLPGQAIAWGAWSGVGMAAEDRDRIAGTLEAAGVGWMRPEQGIEALSRLVREDAPAVVAASMNWDSLGGAGSAPPPFLSELAPDAGEDRDAGVRDNLVERIRETPGREARERLVAGFVAEQVQAALRLSSPPSPETRFFDLGMDSIMAVEFRNRIVRALPAESRLPNTVVIDHPTIARLARYVVEQVPDSEAPPQAPRRPVISAAADVPVAIVGMACRFPGAPDVRTFASFLAAGRSSFRPRRPDDFGWRGAAAEETGYAGYIEDITRFDAGFFGIPAAEARFMEPQHRLLLETSWHALEDAGIPGGSLDGSRTGVYGALGAGDRGYGALLARGEAALGIQGLTGSQPSTAVGRISYFFGLEGPAIAVDTACSSSLVTVHQAVLDLQRHHTDLALAGGANVILSGEGAKIVRASGVLSRAGRAAAFEASADGYVRGEGCGMLVLKRLPDAEADGDRILAVLRGSAVNQDGTRAQLSAPAGSGQQRVMEETLVRAGIEPAEVDYLEAHAVGSPLGDPIEVHAVSAAYGRGRSRSRPLLLGSVKANIGHLEAAAGVAAVIKTVVALRSPEIPAQPDFGTPSLQVPWDDLPVQVTATRTPWPGDPGRPRRAGVSAFGFSGTNAHLVLEDHGGPTAHPGEVVGAPQTVPVAGEVEPPAVSRESDPRRVRLLPLSAKTPGALKSLASAYLGFLGGSPSGKGTPELADLAWTAGGGRDHFPYRAGLVFAGARDLKRSLRDLAERTAGPPSKRPGRVLFLFSGEGAEWAGMGRSLYETEPVARAVLDRCDRAFGDTGAGSLLEVMFHGPGSRKSAIPTGCKAPALYALEAALVAMWSSLGVRPDAAAGAGSGQLAAAYAATVYRLEDGLRLAALRGVWHALSRRRRGAMLISPAGRPGAAGTGPAPDPTREPIEKPAGGGTTEAGGTNEAVRRLNVAPGPDRIHLAPLAEGRQIAYGSLRAVEALADRLRLGGTVAQIMPASKSAVSEFIATMLSGTRLAHPAVEIFESTTGRMSPRQILDTETWLRTALAPSAAERAPEWFAVSEADVAIEIAPRSALKPSAGRERPASAPAERVVSSQAGPGIGNATQAAGGFLHGVAQAYAAGLDIRFGGLFAGERRRRVALPEYPFRRERYWASAPPARPTPMRHALLGERRRSARGEVTFDSELRRSEPPWFKDHRRFGEIAAPPGLLAAQLVSAAVLERPAAEVAVVEDLRLYEPLVVPRHSPGKVDGQGVRRVQIVAGCGNGAGERARALAVFSRDPAAETWVRHAEALLPVNAEAPPASGPATWEDLVQGLEPVDLSRFYRGMAASGLVYDWAYRILTEVWAAPGRSLGRLRLREAMPAAGIELHPVLLEACFHTAALAAAEAPSFPVGWRHFWLRGVAPAAIICDVRTARPSKGASAEIPDPHEADLRLYDAAGTEIGGALGLAFTSASAPVPLRDVG